VDGSPAHRGRFALPDTEEAATVGRGVPAEPSWRPVQVSRTRFDGPSGETQAGQGFQSCKSWEILFILSKFIPPMAPQKLPSHFPEGSGVQTLGVQMFDADDDFVPVARVPVGRQIIPAHFGNELLQQLAHFLDA
jgi:hypothetical protein